MASHSDKSSDKHTNLRRSRLQQYKMEAAGIVVIAVLILAFTLIRYWRQITWGPR